MHKKFHASGFFYHLPTQQILLQQHKSSAPLWSLFGGENKKAEDPIDTFNRTVSKELKLKITPKAIHPIYDYFDKKLNNNCFLFYALISSKNKKMPARKDCMLEWFTIKQISKLPIDEQTKQDIMIGKRVIDAAARTKEGVKKDPRQFSQNKS